MTVLVTGATGFLGSHLTELLLAAGERPRVLVRPGEAVGASAGEVVDVFRGDVADRGARRPSTRARTCAGSRRWCERHSPPAFDVWCMSARSPCTETTSGVRPTRARRCGKSRIPT